MSAASSSSASAPVSALLQIAASTVASTRGRAAAVSVEDESTKRCSACTEDRPESAYSSAQLKKKGKRVCQSCVARKEDAAQTGAQRKDAFAARLQSAAICAPSRCLCCPSNQSVIRTAACIRCTVPCCSLPCFSGHKCDAYLEAKRTMPTVLILEEDRFASVSEMSSLWFALLHHSRSMISFATPGTEWSRSKLKSIDDMARAMPAHVWWETQTFFWPPRIDAPWWNPALMARLRMACDIKLSIVQLTYQLFCISESVSGTLQDFASMVMEIPDAVGVHGEAQPRVTCDQTAPCFLPGRLLHRLLTLLLWICRSMGSEWMRSQFASPGDLSRLDFGTLPDVAFHSPVPLPQQMRLGYVAQTHPHTGLRTLVPLYGNADPEARFTLLQQHLGYKSLMMVTQGGKPILDQGLYLYVRRNELSTEMSAVTGWTGSLHDSFTAAPVESYFRTASQLQQALSTAVARGDQPRAVAIVAELSARKQPDYFHIILAVQSVIAKQDWPTKPGHALFIATPQRGIESELVELSLLESLVEDAAAGDAHAQLLLTHIEAECAAPIAEVISAQKSRLEQMLEDQAAQLRIHAEAVARAELRRKIKPAAGEGGASSAFSPSSALAPSSAASAIVPSSSSSSTASPSALFTASACVPVVECPVPYSWTASKAYTSLAELCTAGRAKYKTITSAALRFLHTLRPVSVNRSGGSHTVFHFASGKPVTLVTPHGGDGTVSQHAATRLYQNLHDVALKQFNPAQPAQGTHTITAHKD